MIQIFSYYDRISAGTPKIQFYYGPVEESEEFLFTVTKNGKVVFSVENSRLLEFSLGEKPEDMFLAGMVLYAGR
jgi:hypothetical protein